VALPARVPPGRAGRMWLRRRLDTAERGRNQLDRKLRILTSELQRVDLQAESCRRDWESACVQARSWLLRAVLLGGQDVLRAATPAELADVELVSTTIMGLSYPSDAMLTPRRARAAFPDGNAAIGPARDAFEAALLAGVRCAATQAAARQVGAEVALTRQRLMALDERWLPGLRELLARLELSLEQAEQEDNVRLRRAAAPKVRRSVP
jgi:V/A-type H+/Na+-transporting ATPase subunit D